MPLCITAWVILFLFKKVDGVLAPLIFKAIGFHVPGLGLICTVFLIYIIGLFTANVLGKGVWSLIDRLIESIPFVHLIYRPAKQFFQSLSQIDESNFKRVVLVEYPRPGLKALAFVTSSSTEPTTQQLLHTIFIPTSPNPTTGMIEIVPQHKIWETNLSVEEGIKLVVSAGTLGTNTIECSQAVSGS